MSRPLFPPLLITPRCSPTLLLLVCLTHALALAVVLALPLGGWRMVLACAVLLSLLKTLWADVLRCAPWSIRSARWNADDTWTLELANGRSLSARLTPASFVGLDWISLVFTAGRPWRRTLVLTADALEVDTLRRLRQRLRLWPRFSPG